MNRRSDTATTVRSAESGECEAMQVDSGAVGRARESLSGASEAAGATAIFSALADPTRLRILEALASGELCVCDLSEVAGVSQSGVSHQLRILRDRGLVTYRRDGLRAVYSLADDHVRDLIGIGLEHARESRSS